MVFPREYLRGALIVSLLSVWVLVVLFYYLNRYTKRNYFTIWTAAWLFYALWLTLGITVPSTNPASFISIVRQWCVGISAIFLLWGSLYFLEIPARQSLFGLFMAFLLTWSYVAPSILNDALLIQLPIFSLIGISSMFAGLSFYRLRKRRQFVGVGMLFLGFFLWGAYLATYPFSQRFEALISVGFLVSAVLQLFIAVSMIVLVLEEARYNNEQMRQQIQSVNTEKEALQIKIISTEEQFRSLFSQKSGLRTDLQKAYEELRQTQHSVVQQERLRALGQMASGIAHDINNALSPIVAFSELILKKAESLDDNSRKNLKHIRTSAEDIAHIVTRMSEFYRRREDNEQLRSVNLNQLAQQVVELTSPRWRDIPLGQGIVIQVDKDFADNLPGLYANESDVREALTNVLLNAVDAMPKGGMITIATRCIPLQTNNATDKAMGHIVLEVRDTGIGMDEKTKQRCLEPFFSTKRSRGGAGLGLAMVYGMMERHDGSIQIESELGKGTTIQLIFPVRAPANGKADQIVTPQETPPMRVLCIDDEPLLRELMKELLEYSKHVVETADSGENGLKRFESARSEGKPFDLVITDLGMPHLDGRQVAERIKTQSPSTPVVLLTGWGAMLDDKGQGSHIDAVVSKPPRLTELNETLARVAAAKKN